jgi:hypothetical protein
MVITVVVRASAPEGLEQVLWLKPLQAVAAVRLQAAGRHLTMLPAFPEVVPSVVVA